MDAISKQRAIDAIRDFQAQITCSFSGMWLNGMNEGFDHAVGVIELMEEVDAEPVRHGTWKKSKISFLIPYYQCSECGGYMDVSPLLFKYCPYCGRKMDGGDDDRKTD